MRKTYGNTWWGKRWLNALANIDFSSRLPRGRTYANKGLVLDFEINKNKISARVQGREIMPYRVTFTIPAFESREKNIILSLITTQPLLLSKLLNRQLPAEIEQHCQQKHVGLFPKSWFDLSGRCSCLDHAVPCKHMAAVLYLIANEIDKNPFLIFQLHDFDLFEELKKIGYTSEAQKEIPILSIQELQEPFNAKRATTEWDSDILRQLDFSRIPESRENLLKILSEKPPFYPVGDFKKIITFAYSGVLKNLKKTEKEEEPAIPFKNTHQVEDIELLLDQTGDFITATCRDQKGETLITFDKLADLTIFIQQLPKAEFSTYSSALKSLVLVYQFCLKLIKQSACIPQLIQIGREQYKIRWIPARLNPIIKSIFSGIKSIVATDLLFYKKGKTILEPIESDKLMALCALFLNQFIKEHHALNYRFKEHEIGHLFFNNANIHFDEPETFDYPTLIQLWLNKFYLLEKSYAPVIQIDEDQDQGFELSIGVQQKFNKTPRPIQLKSILAQKKYANLRMDVLRDLAMLSDYFPQISQLIASGGKEKLYFDSDAFVNILFNILPVIRLFGIKILLPKALKNLLKPQLSLALTSEEEGEAIKKKSFVNLDNMLSFQWKIALGNQLISEEDFFKLVKFFSGIVRLQDKYVFLNEAEIQTLIQQIKAPPDLNTNQLLQIALTENYQGAKVKLDKSAQQLMTQLLDGNNVTVPKGLQATLRPYQLSGFNWLYKNYRIGFGSILADDMGLGKTLQVITLLLKLKEDGIFQKQKALIIVPTTLLTNWMKEIKKFAPSLKAFVYHGTNRTLNALSESDVLITTYGVARSETDTFKKTKWAVLAIDEAQAIKTPSTAQTKAIKKLKAPIRIAMSGTPVENRLSEYWSIFDFISKGYLGSLANFKADFAKPIEADRDQEKLDAFKKVTAPFILRRLKSDKSIIKDLPQKIEKDQFCQLTLEQTATYQNVVDSTLKAVQKAEGINRKGLILKLITALKQVCNHPWQFRKKGSKVPSLSGKCMMLFDLLRQIQQNGEKTLIFTQYQEMGKLLVELLEKEFNLNIPFLHGGVSRKGRDEMVDDFQNNRATRILILSLKAGGTGLNLTEANNVIHYDLWWNPAVEAQATDRAYRIGQKRNVLVHRFITQNTFEEKINEMLQEKKELANLTVSTGEKWIGDLSNQELRELIKLE